MSDEKQTSADVLARVHRAWSPAPSDAERVRRALGAVLASGGSVSPTTAPRRAPAWTARIVVGGAIAAASAGVGYWAGHRAGLRDATIAAPTVVAPAVEGPHPATSAQVTSRSASDAETFLAPVRPRSDGHAARHDASDHGPVPGDSLAVEVRALRNIERALRDGNPGLAVAFLEELDRQVPHGQLTEERDAAATLARCARGAPPFGVDLAAEFAERHPESVYRARVAQACAKTDSTTSGDSPSGRSRE
jgi:hypothetical protein